MLPSMVDMTERIDTHSKALAINLDKTIYGTLAEIGAGQEVARWFLQVGGAAGTVAKTMSAYDMKVSDVIYGGSSRYVSRDRLVAMLEHEYRLLMERLDEPRGADTRFFVFAATRRGSSEWWNWGRCRIWSRRSRSASRLPRAISTTTCGRRGGSSACGRGLRGWGETRPAGPR